MNYFFLEKHISDISKNMFPQICIDMDKFENKQYNHYFALVNEIYKGLALCCNAMEIQAYAQIGTLLRQLIEQVATAKIISTNENALLAYSSFAKAQLFSLRNNRDKSELEKLYDTSALSKKAKGKKLDFYSYGWLESAGVEVIDAEALIKTANMSDLYDWRGFCNNFVHSTLTFMNIAPDKISHYIEEFTYILGALCDEISCNYHHLTGFDFVFNGVDLFSKFRKELADITEYRKQTI